jgi:hypothetical protein
LTKRSPASFSRREAPGRLAPSANACIGRDIGPNQPRYAFTSRSCGAMRGSVKCSELPTDTASRRFEPTWNPRTRLAVRSVCTRPSRNAKLGSPREAAMVAWVPPLGEARPVMK